METAEKRVRHIDTVDVAKLVRAALKTAYPVGTKFSVRSDIYSGGSSIRVSWTDGPTTRDVEKIVGKFHGADFDGMIDLKTHHEGDLNGERVQFSNDWIFCSRKVTDENELRIIAESIIRKKCRTEGTPPDDRFGGQWVKDLAGAMVYWLSFPDPNGPVTAEEWDRSFRIAVLREGIYD
jgi:hypothetical protein